MWVTPEKAARIADAVQVSAVTGDGLQELRAKISEVLQGQGVAIDLELPYAVVGEVEALRARTGIRVAYEDAALRVTGFAPPDAAAELRQLKRRAVGRVL